MNGIKYIENFIDAPLILLADFKNETGWDARMKARLTASFGVAYNYSQIT